MKIEDGPLRKFLNNNPELYMMGAAGCTAFMVKELTSSGWAAIWAMLAVLLALYGIRHGIRLALVQHK